MALMKCPDCGKKVSENALSCPGCGCPNKGNFLMITPKPNKKLLWCILPSVVVVIFSVILFILLLKPSSPSYSDSPFYCIKDMNWEQIVSRYGTPRDEYSASGYIEYTFDSFSFMDINGELVIRFDDNLPASIIFARWIIDGAKYSEEEIEDICDFYDIQLGKRSIEKDGRYEWNIWLDDERIWFRKPAYPKGYYEFEYRPW